VAVFVGETISSFTESSLIKSAFCNKFTKRLKRAQKDEPHFSDAAKSQGKLLLFPTISCI